MSKQAQRLHAAEAERRSTTKDGAIVRFLRATPPSRKSFRTTMEVARGAGLTYSQSRHTLARMRRDGIVERSVVNPKVDPHDPRNGKIGWRLTRI